MPAGANRGIMVIGFDDNFCYLMQRFGRISACPLEIVRPDENLLDQVRISQPAVIFLEAVHPNYFAGKLIKELKTNPDTCQIYIILCSWQAEEPNIDQQSPDDYLQLPILYEHFQSALKRVEE